MNGNNLSPDSAFGSKWSTFFFVAAEKCVNLSYTRCAVCAPNHDLLISCVFSKTAASRWFNSCQRSSDLMSLAPAWCLQHSPLLICEMAAESFCPTQNESNASSVVNILDEGLDFLCRIPSCPRRQVEEQIMRYAIISDIHGNLAALEQVLKQIDETGVDQLVCLGDVVGYGPYPNECCEIIQDKADICLLGNHDSAAIGLTDAAYFNRYARSAIGWTARVLNEKNAAFLRQLPMTAVHQGLMFVHSSPLQPEEWNYVFTIDEAFDQFQSFEQQICFIGHSHIPIVWNLQESGFPKSSVALKVKIVKGCRYIINVGSVGQPRDDNPDACYGIFDDAQKIFSLHRIRYNVAQTQQAMRDLDLPVFLIDRLQFGK
ncbi:MAG: metallophosphoesterase [Calditrichaeota bacterium]|nr:MAG: metallophosphoesterase [Calditrichota bacterium]